MLTWEHPRARGENSSEALCVVLCKGTSPRTRGKRPEPFVKVHVFGNIPAHAGKTVQKLHKCMPKAEHPRARGENAGAAWDDVVGGRNIPAHAGKTHTRSGRCAAMPEHPRARGENVPTVPLFGIVPGTSPRTRGKLIPVIGQIAQFRNIPAHAGKTRFRRSTHSRIQEHPRARGENCILWLARAIVEGTSPRTRGKLVQRA